MGNLISKKQQQNMWVKFNYMQLTKLFLFMIKVTN